MDEENRLFSESIEQHRELVCNKLVDKYENKPQRVVEPNLTKLMQARKERA